MSVNSWTSSRDCTASRAALQGPPKVEATIERVGLTPEAHKTISPHCPRATAARRPGPSHLSTTPSLLILDEPTSGLDPLQLKDIRALIRSFGEERTVILSTHIMQEVEAMCDRVIMIKQGRIVTDAPLKDILAQGGLEETFNTLAG